RTGRQRDRGRRTPGPRPDRDPVVDHRARSPATPLARRAAALTVRRPHHRVARTPSRAGGGRTRVVAAPPAQLRQSTRARRKRRGRARHRGSRLRRGTLDTPARAAGEEPRTRRPHHTPATPPTL